MFSKEELNDLLKLMDSLIEAEQSEWWHWSSKRSRDRGESWEKTSRLEVLMAARQVMAREVLADATLASSRDDQ